ncbi:hypothetical protein [Streptomyces galbus]|uniref:Uncharacterized protein n=1 Tax=Streptomyces galbus TaxID=33898 RepID=A0A4U5WYT7_STRGB|nr:hypothetical protein [Streptomyces galbus]TKT06861.1 hypothetical protein E4U92_23525 [Streptomyces galbus]GHD35700.1 hypothetical protein GCM10010335_31230 [Streptomyces galbus]
MPAYALLSAVLEQAVQWKYGTAGAAGLFLLTVGLRARIPAAVSLGAVILAVLVTGPAVSS